MASGAGFKNMNPIFPELQEIQKENIITKDALKKLKVLAMGSTIHLVSNCEDVTDWDISDSSVFNAVNETSDIRTGSNAIELVDVGTTKGDFVTLDDVHRPEREDWGEFNWLCLWIHDDSALRLTGELTIQIRNNLTWCTAINVPVCQSADMFEYKCIDISGIDKNNVDGIRFVNQRGTGSDEKVYIDQIIVTDFITGVGDGAAIGVGPVIGPCAIAEVISGATILPGDTVQFAQPGVKLGVADGFELIGVAGQFEATDSYVASDTAPVEVIYAAQGATVMFRNDGTGLAIGNSGKLATDVVAKGAGRATASAEKDFCYSLETSTGASWKSGDSSYLLAMAGTED